MEKVFTVRVALREYTRTGDVWLYDNFKNYRLVKVVNTETLESAVLSYRHIDENYEKEHNDKKEIHKISEGDSIIIIDEYFRHKLSLEKNESYKLKIVGVRKYGWNSLRYLREHPNDSIRITTCLAIVSILISIISPIFICLLKIFRDFITIIITITDKLCC